MAVVQGGAGATGAHGTTGHHETFDESILPRRRGRKGKPKPLKKRGLRFGVLGYVMLGIVSFSLFFVMKVPLNRMQGQILNTLSQQSRLDWEADEVEISLILGPRIIFRNLTITEPRPMPGDPLGAVLAGGLSMQELVFRPSILQLIPIPFLKESVPAGSFSARLYGTEIDGSFAMGTLRSSISLSTEDLNLANIPALRQAINVQGVIKSLDLDLQAPRARAGTASGEIRLQAGGLRFDAGSLSSAAFVKSLGTLQFGDLNVDADLRNGRLKLNQLTMGGSKGADLSLRLDGTMRLNDRITRSEMDLILNLTPGPKLQEVFANPLISGLIPFDKRPNGSYALKLQGNFEVPRPSPHRGG